MFRVCKFVKGDSLYFLSCVPTLTSSLLSERFSSSIKANPPPVCYPLFLVPLSFPILCSSCLSHFSFFLAAFSPSVHLLMLFPKVLFLTHFSPRWGCVSPAPAASAWKPRAPPPLPCCLQHHRLLKSGHAAGQRQLGNPASALLARPDPALPCHTCLPSLSSPIQAPSTEAWDVLPGLFLFLCPMHVASHQVLSVLLSEYLLVPLLFWLWPSPYFASVTAVVFLSFCPAMPCLLH